MRRVTRVLDDDRLLFTLWLECNEGLSDIREKRITKHDLDELKTVANYRPRIKITSS